MTISDIKDRIDQSYDDLDDLNQIPEEIRGEISLKLEEIMDLLEKCIEDYGEDPIEDDDEIRDADNNDY